MQHGKVCPAPYVKNKDAWNDFLRRVFMEDKKELTTQEKCKVIEDYYGLDSNTTQYFQFYRYAIPLIDKLYYRAKNAQK